MIKKIDSKTLFIVVAIVVLFSFNLYMFRYDIFFRPNDNLIEVEINDFRGIKDLMLTGEVYEVLDNIGNYHSTGILRVNIIDSNIELYDPRDKQANYYCIIKNGQAEVYESELTGTKKGDTILIDIKKGATRIVNALSKKDEKKATIIYPRNFFDFLKRKGYQEI